jgi:adenine-specific DNA-methyltransferase
MSIEKITPENPLSHSEDLVANNIEKLKALFPEIVIEGKIDFKVLQGVLGEEIEEGEEYYRFTWAGKAQARREAHKPSTGTLRPAKVESVDWETTKNLYIEGDNLEVLKLLQKSYAGKVKMIYIDPPYNTGKDFVYKDNYKDNLRNYQEATGQLGSDSKSISTNSDSEGRYHSNWLNMMYPRLRLARSLMKNDGVIFISIDENEYENLKKVGDEIFGESNFLGTIIWKNKFGAGAKNKGFIGVHEYIICFSKEEIINITSELSDSEIKKHNREDSKFEERGGYRIQPLMTKSMDDRPNLVYPIIYNGNEIHPNKQWVWSKERMLEAIANDNVEFMEKDDGSVSVNSKQYLKDENGFMRRGKPTTFYDKVYTQNGTKELLELFDEKIFDFNKPVDLIKYFISFQTNDNNTFKDGDIILDFFSGSSTSAQAVLELNIEDGGNRKYIQVQLPEVIDEKNVAYRGGYRTITQIGKERIRRVGVKLVNDQELVIDERKRALEKMISGNLLLIDNEYQLPNNVIADDKVKELLQEINNKKLVADGLDTGFKVFKLDSSNIRTWDGSLDGKELEATLRGYIDNTKDSETTVDEDGQIVPNLDIRSEEDILFEILLKYGLDLTLPIEEKEIAGKKVFNVGLGALFICLSNNITSQVAEGIGQWKTEVNPEVCRVVFKDNGFTDVEKTNSVQILKRFGITEIKTL